MSSKLLTDVGRALYGDRWQTALSRDLGISDRTMRRWAAGVDDVPRGVYTDLHRIVLERAAELQDLIPQLVEASTPD
ncbi:MAG TPA: hypothetical protein VIK75_10130 [Calditerricola sp.]